MTEKDWRERLMRRHAELFGRGGYPTVGDGWRELVETAIARIAAAVASVPGAKVTITQIKEKYGGLRIYFDGGGLSDEAEASIEEAIELAEYRAACTCEDCGSQGQLYDNHGWYITRCEAHAEGEAVPPAPGLQNLRIRRVLVDGKLRIVAAHCYDRARDAFVEVPVAAPEDD